jgi:hypothetical protein
MARKIPTFYRNQLTNITKYIPSIYHKRYLLLVDNMYTLYSQNVKRYMELADNRKKEYDSLYSKYRKLKTTTDRLGLKIDD